MATVNVELSEVYSVELKLRKEEVDKYKALGIERLLEEVQKHALCESRSSTEPMVYELLEGCHRSRALFELGYSGRVTIMYNGIAEGTPEILLKDAPIVDDDEFEAYRKEDDMN